MTAIIETVKAKIDVADEIGSVVVLQRSGKSLKGLCPFHNERSPSFYVFRETQSWHCFGCNKGGDVFAFVQEQQGLDFREALHYLAEKAGVAVEEQGERSEEEREQSIARERLLKLNEEALLWFHQSLLRSKEAEEARAYVQSRGISTDSIIAFSLGHAGSQREGLAHYLLTRGYSEHELVSGGLARWRESETREGMRDGIYDYFRDRLVFPIRDIRGRVIGFGGRALGDSKPKYLNSPQTLLFEKNTVLYGIDMAKDAIKQVGQVVIVEGYVDAVMAHQYGTRQTVACIGSAITEKHIQQLKKLTRQVTLALDPDAAGSAATEHGIQEAFKGFDRTVVPVPLAAGRSERAGSRREEQRDGKKRPGEARSIVRLEEQVDAEINVLQLPANVDPDEFIQRDYAGWLYKVAHPLPLIDYYFDVKTANLNLREPMGKAEASKRILPVIGMISDRTKRDAYLRKLAGMIHIDERTLYADLQRVLRGQQSSSVNADFSGKGSASSARSRSLLEGAKSTSDSLLESEKESEERDQRSSGQQEFSLDKHRDSTLKWEDYLIGLLLCNPALSQYVCGIITDSDFAGTDTRELYHILNSAYQRGASPSLQPFESFVPPALLPAVVRVTKCVEAKSLSDGAWLVKEAEQCAIRLKRTRLLQLNIELGYLIQEAENTGDKPAVRQLSLKRIDIDHQLRTLYSATRLQG